MKTVLDPQTVAHYWANKVQNHATNSNRSFYFNDDTIYSYGRHFPIAKHFGDKVIFTTRSYSNTTAKHISIVRAACSHLAKIYAPHVDGRHSDNFDVWKRDIEQALNAMKTARKPEKYFEAVEHTKQQVNEYCKALNVKPPSDLKKLLALTFENAGELAKKQAAKEKRERENIINKGSKIFSKYVNLWREGQSYEQIREQINDSNRAILQKYINMNDFTYLRVIDGQVETSKGVKLPIDVAKRYVDAYFNNAINKGDRILHYTVSNVNKAGIQIGCHNIPLEQINYLKSII
jgi:hypothetical protein